MYWRTTNCVMGQLSMKGFLAVTGKETSNNINIIIFNMKVSSSSYVVTIRNHESVILHLPANYGSLRQTLDKKARY